MKSRMRLLHPMLGLLPPGHACALQAPQPQAWGKPLSLRNKPQTPIGNADSLFTPSLSRSKLHAAAKPESAGRQERRNPFERPRTPWNHGFGVLLAPGESRMRRPVLLSLLAVLLLLAPPAPAAEKRIGNACTGDQNATDWDTIAQCVGGTFQRAPYFLGTTTTGCTGAIEGMLRYNTTDKAAEYCNGSAWTRLYQVQSSPPPAAPAGSGYFVLTSSTWDGNLGGLAGADAKCLTELTVTNTAWNGYATALANGQLIASKVRAFLCSGICANLMPLATYYFAVSGDPTAGGGFFTTDASARGPGDNNSWASPNYFNGVYTWWSSRGLTSSSLWSDSPTSNRCSNWGSTSGNGVIGNTSSMGSGRWNDNIGNTPCNDLKSLICFVNP